MGGERRKRPKRDINRDEMRVFWHGGKPGTESTFIQES